MSIPVSCCFRTTSATAWRRVCSYAAASYAFPGALLFASATSSGGRIKLPTCVVRKRPWLRFMNRPPSLSPQLLTSDARTLHHRGQLRPSHLFVPHAGADAAVGAGLDVLAANALGVAHQPLGHQFGMLDEVGRVGDDARHQHPALRQPDLLPDVVLVVVAHFRRLDGVLPGLDLHQDVGDVLELDVVDVRPVAAPPAGVKADELLRQAAQGVVEDLDRMLQKATVLRRVPVGIKHPRGAELRLVDLDDEPGVGDRLVLLPAGVRHRHQVLVLAGVMLVADARPQAHRAEGRDIALNVLAGDGRLQVGDVGAYRFLAGVLDWARAGSRLPLGRLARLAGRGEAGTDGAAGAGEPEAGGVEARELTPVALRRAGALRGLPRG